VREREKERERQKDRERTSATLAASTCQVMSPCKYCREVMRYRRETFTTAITGVVVFLLVPTPVSLRDPYWFLRGKDVDRLRVGFSGRGTARAEDAQGTPAQSHISPSMLVYEDYFISRI